MLTRVLMVYQYLYDHHTCIKLTILQFLISSFKPSSVAKQVGLCQTWSETPKTSLKLWIWPYAICQNLILVWLSYLYKENDYFTKKAGSRSVLAWFILPSHSDCFMPKISALECSATHLSASVVTGSHTDDNGIKQGSILTLADKCVAEHSKDCSVK